MKKKVNLLIFLVLFLNDAFAQSGDNLGNHTATQILNMSGNNIENVGVLKTKVAIINNPWASQGNNYAAFSHKNMANTTQYALLQHQEGTTYLNAAPGRDIFFRIGNVSTKMIVKNNGNVGIGTINPSSLLEIRQISDPNSDKGLVISEENNSQKIYLHLADNANGEYGYLDLGGTTQLRGNGVYSSFQGAVGIGTTNPGSYKLAVNGKIRAKEIVVETGWADFVFEEGYKLPSLSDVERHIKVHGHLKDIPSAQEVKENGIGLGEINTKLLQKLEELTLYTIQQEKEIEKLKQIATEFEALKTMVENMKKQN